MSYLHVQRHSWMCKFGILDSKLQDLYLLLSSVGHNVPQQIKYFLFVKKIWPSPTIYWYWCFYCCYVLYKHIGNTLFLLVFIYKMIISHRKWIEMYRMQLEGSWVWPLCPNFHPHSKYSIIFSHAITSAQRGRGKELNLKRVLAILSRHDNR